TLAAQYGIKVTLSPAAAGGGIRAVMTIPETLVVPAERAPEGPATRRSNASRLVGMAGRMGPRTRRTMSADRPGALIE
ncbi:MAG: hypothetical protein SYR96_39675, partial [Actinomycetota bacterium]|nr:hypothetical protein [Actinomycetota bacterium]